MSTSRGVSVRRPSRWMVGVGVLLLAASVPAVTRLPGEAAAPTTHPDRPAVAGAEARPAPARSGRRVSVGFSPGFAIIDAEPRRLRRELRGMRALGARHLRIDVSWARVEGIRGHYDWTDTDRVVRAARKARLRVLGVLDYQPSWAGPAGVGVGEDPSRFAAFAAAAGARYAGRVSAWELWNEPNLGPSWPGGPNPEEYARLVASTGAALRAADPSATVVAGSLAPAVDADDGSELSPETFLRRFYAATPTPGRFDAVSVHPYSYPALPGRDEEWNTFHRLPAIHDVMVHAGDGALKLWLTEYGAPTGRSAQAVSPRRQARMLVSAVRRAARLDFVGPLFVYSFRDAGPDARDPEDNFGVLDHRGRPKASFWALRRALHRGGR